MDREVAAGRLQRQQLHGLRTKTDGRRSFSPAVPPADSDAAAWIPVPPADHSNSSTNRHQGHTLGTDPAHQLDMTGGTRRNQGRSGISAYADAICTASVSKSAVNGTDISSQLVCSTRDAVRNSGRRDRLTRVAERQQGRLDEEQLTALANLPRRRSPSTRLPGQAR